MKLSSENLGIGQMLFIRGVIAIVVFSLVIKISGKPVISKVIFSKWVFLRALCESGATMFFITGLTMMPIAINATLLWTSPIFLTIAGSTSAGGCMKLYSDLVKYNMVDAVIATGASIIDMDFFEALGFKHYQGSQFQDDAELRKNYIDRIYDT